MSSSKDRGQMPPPEEKTAGQPGTEGASAPAQPAAADFFPEDERSPFEKEDDHSFADFDLPSEIEAAAAKAERLKQEGRGSPGEENPADLYFPEDERAALEMEDDHSMAAFDLDAEIEAKLGKAPSEPVLTPEPPLPPQDEAFSDSDYFPEDERVPMESEDDHSMTEFNLSPEIAAAAEKAEDSSPQAFCQSSPSADGAGDYFPEDERVPMESEDDHSFTDFDLHGDVACASAKADSPSSEDEAVLLEDDYFPEDERSPIDVEEDFSKAPVDIDAEIEAKLGPEEKLDTEEAVEQGHMHPDLAAALQSSFAYAAHGVQEEPEEESAEPQLSRAEAARNEEGLDVGDDLHSPLEPEDSGDDDPAPPDESRKQMPKDDDPFAVLNIPDSAPAGKAEAPAEEEDEDDEEGDEEEDPEDEDDDSSDEDDEEEEDEDDRPMTLRDHLLELRKRVFRAFLWAIVGFFICYPFAEQIFNLLVAPLQAAMPDASHFIFTAPAEAFFTFLKVALVAGFFVTCPMIFYQIWAFVAPGLYKEEKLYLLPVVLFSAFFFICGGAFCYLIALPFAFEFFMSYNTELIKALPKLSETLSFVLQLLMAFGFVFEMPLFVFFLSRLGIVTADMMRKFRRYAILANVILAAILTPPDVMSQMLMAVPLLLLYELSIFIAVIFGKKKKPEPAAEEDEDDDEDDDDEEPAENGQKQLT